MYNKEQKERFIQECSRTKLAAMLSASLFNASEEYEKKFKCDICDMSEDQLRKMVGVLNGLQGRTAAEKMNILVDYESWCIKNGITPERDELRINTVAVDDIGISTLKTQMVSTPKELQKQLNVYFLPEEKETVDNIYRAYFWLAFSGLNQDDIYKLRSSNIDFKNMCIEFTQRFYPIYTEEVKCLKNCTELKEFVSVNPNYAQTKQTRYNSDILFRGTRGLYSQSSLMMMVSRRIKSVNKKSGTGLSYKRVWFSGMFYRMYEREQLGFPVNFRPLAEELISGKEYDFSKTKSTKGSVVGRKAKEMEDSYHRWKLAFNK